MDKLDSRRYLSDLAAVIWGGEAVPLHARRGGFMICLSALGAVDLRDESGRDLTAVLLQPKRLALLSYLVIARPRRFHRREVLLSLFWPRSDPSTGRNSLRQALHFLRQVVGDDVIVSRGENEIGINRNLLWCDAVAFVNSLEERAPGEAMTLYRGALMPGTVIADAPEFNRWLDDERDYLRLRVEETLESEAVAAENDGNLALALRARRRSSALEPLSARVALALMQTLVNAGDRAAAIQHATVFSRSLRNELDLECDETVSSFTAALRREPSGARPGYAMRTANGVGVSRSYMATKSPAP
jgi:DNA-binding SARP family transcriptional activator